MKATLFKQLAQSLREAGKIRRGKMKPFRTMKYDPTIQVPPEIFKMALEIDKWAKTQGFESYCIGPICSRGYAQAYEDCSGVSTQPEWESNPPPMPPHTEP